MENVYLAAFASFALLVLIIWKAKSNPRKDAMMDEGPRKAWYQVRCRECEELTPHGALTDGLCRDCLAKADADATPPIEITMLMMNAGLDQIRASPERDSRAVAAVFNAMLKAIPIEQKRILLRNPVFAPPKREDAA